MTFHRLPGRFIRTDKTNVGLHPRSVICFSVTVIPARIFSTVCLEEGGIGEVPFPIVAHQQNASPPGVWILQQTKPFARTRSATGA
jgi:hypothetical protein